MSELAVRVEGLGKEYRLGGPRERYSTLRDRLNKLASAPFRALRGSRERSEQNPPFWALKEVSFEVRPGEVVGIIGRNGAGKSTLLKILSRITEPTEGDVDISGRVGSLLEVGTGFHPELTGRENVYLNGAILGMRRAEIARKFDEIVAFAEVEKFIDTPVKHYSSGMYMRLAFAVAAHLEPEILIVDEVLAVGDVQFQKKCLGKMGDVARGGRTVLFVSHNMQAVQSLCTRGILLREGQVAFNASAVACVRAYLEEANTEHGMASTLRPPRPASLLCWIEQARLLSGGEERSAIVLGDDLEIEVTFAANPPTRNPRLGFVVTDGAGVRVLNSNNRYMPFIDPPTPISGGIIRCNLGRLPLVAGRYYITLVMGDLSGDYHAVLDQMTFEVISRDIWGTGQSPPTGAGAIWWQTTFELAEGIPGVER